MTVDIPNLALEEDVICFKCWGSGVIDKQDKLILEKCKNCTHGYVQEITPFGKEVLEFIKKHLKEKTQE